jgi:hypothetical protein
MSPPLIARCSTAAIAIAGALLLAGCAAGTSPGSNAPTSSPEQYAEFDAPQLAQTCIDATRSAFASDVEFDIETVRIEERTVQPEWLVLVPARTAGGTGEAQCTIGGSPASPVVEMSSASLVPLPEEQVQNLIRGENEGGTK